MQFVLVAVHLVAIVLANLSVAAYGPSVAIVNAFLFIGLDLVTRDKLHEAWQGRGLWVRMACLIFTGSALSYALNKDAGPIAIASFVAFMGASLADLLVYHVLRARGWMERSNGSNLAGAAVDSVLFPLLAFGGLPLGIMAGQFVAKVLGGLVWSWLLRGTQKEAVNEYAS